MYPTLATRMQATRRLMRAPPAEDQAGHTVSQRLRKLRKIPAELIPLGVVVGFAVFAAGYSSARKFWVDKTLRLQRQNRAADAAASGEHH
ncbi:hypothetical protein JX265_003174 [Neoarthrinium moseri]|uniref:Uncharacterized protein n=1 Tax=Neoarthrinium moseri TaxID=1658444 RepID=A0A9Q0ATU8_9PEZI|nr:uncharacterized protein JN550_005590 [Neoarthrinium moseri]KAI1852685.1 hypothetical protein JX266_002226 [Neoarthrinium moseri]KAI1870000.1 hypothetical protein JN550_005590 [Neoarthrinium moseri]KAI1878997.1 hypothetical protein JX265_003174 [Neoarthrinium moseri]